MTLVKLTARVPLGEEPHGYAGKHIKNAAYCLKTTTTITTIGSVLQIAVSERACQQSRLILFLKRLSELTLIRRLIPLARPPKSESTFTIGCVCSLGKPISRIEVSAPAIIN